MVGLFGEFSDDLSLEEIGLIKYLNFIQHIDLNIKNTFRVRSQYKTGVSLGELTHTCTKRTHNYGVCVVFLCSSLSFYRQRLTIILPSGYFSRFLR